MTVIWFAAGMDNGYGRHSPKHNKRPVKAHTSTQEIRFPLNGWKSIANNENHNLQ